jgi:predicted ester cyclase
MAAERTAAAMRAYLDALVARGRYADHFAQDVVLTMMGGDQEARGPAAVQQLIDYLHVQAFDATPEIRGLFVAEGKAALEADFVGRHIGEFGGVPASGAAVRVPYSVIYDLAGDKITALRIYMPVNALMAQLQGAAADR